MLQRERLRENERERERERERVSGRERVMEKEREVNTKAREVNQTNTIVPLKRMTKHFTKERQITKSSVKTVNRF